jgi:phenylalanyl-tRNA synthetase beta chain
MALPSPCVWRHSLPARRSRAVGHRARRVDFFDVKADVEDLFAPRRLEFVKVAHPALHPGRCAEIRLDGVAVGVIGELHPRWVQKYELGTAPVLFERTARVAEHAIPGLCVRFPACRPWCAIWPWWCRRRRALAPLLEALRAAAPATVRDVALFDVYQGKGLADGEKSLAFRIVMQDTQRTLEDAEVDAVIADLLAMAARDFGASLRG